MKIKNKILLVTPLPPPLGGIATWSKNILSYDATLDQIIVANIAVSRGITNKKKIVRVLSGLQQCLKLLLTYCIHLSNFKLVYVNTSASLGLMRDLCLLMLSKLFSKKIIFHYHFGRIPQMCKKNSLEWKILIFIAKRANHIITIDQDSFNTLYPIVGSKLTNIPNPISLELEKLAIENKSVHIENNFVFVGHVVKEKGLEELIHAFNELEDVNFKLTIIGPYQNSYLSFLKKMINRDRASNIRFIGPLSIDQVIKEIAISDALVLPSYSEGFPNVVLEALSCGAVVLASDVGAIKDMLKVDSEVSCGFTCSPHDCESLLNIIKEFRSLSIYDKDILRDKGIKKILSHYKLSSVMEKYIKIVNVTIQR